MNEFLAWLRTVRPPDVAKWFVVILFVCAGTVFMVWLIAQVAKTL